ncbi:MAG: hydrogenase maturation protease [Bacteroidetes bacterium]|nr:hydrogenase maturation protease [Bacteroidota bacterium]
MDKPDPSILILGVGNYLMGDEGVGVHLVRMMEKDPLPEGVDLLDGGTAGFQLMEYLERYPTVIMVDATLDKNPVGTIRMIEPKFSQDFPKAMSTHEIGLKDLIESLSLMGKMPKVYLFVISVADIANLHIGLSPQVKAAMDLLKNRILKLTAALQNDTVVALD